MQQCGDTLLYQIMIDNHTVLELYTVLPEDDPITTSYIVNTNFGDDGVNQARESNPYTKYIKSKSEYILSTGQKSLSALISHPLINWTSWITPLC